MVQEQLALHKKEGEIMRRPPQDTGADFVVEALEGRAAVVVAIPLPSQHCKTLE